MDVAWTLPAFARELRARAAYLTGDASTTAVPTTPRDWRAAFADPDPTVGAGAAAALARSDDARAAVSVLLDSLRGADERVRVLVTRALGVHIEEDVRASAALRGLTDDPNPQVRLAALAAWLERDDEKQLPEAALERLADDADKRVRRRLMNGVRGSWFRDLPDHVFHRGSRDADPGVRHAAWAALGYGLRGGIADTQFRRGLQDDDPVVRAVCLQALASRLRMSFYRKPPRTDHLIPLLRTALRDAHEAVRVHALMAIAQLPSERWRFTPDLIEALADPLVRALALEGLGHEDLASPLVVDALAQLILEHKSRESAAKALGKLGRPAERAIPLLRTLLESPHVTTKIAAVEALAALGEDKAALADGLVPILAAKDPMQRVLAVDALKALGKGRPQIIAALRPLLEDPAASVRTAAGRAVCRMGPMEPDLVAAVARLFSDPEARVREDVGSWLNHADAADLDVARGVARTVLETGPVAEHAEAALWLVEGGDTSPLLKPALVHIVHHGESPDIEEAVRGLARIQPPPVETIPLIEALLDHDDDDVRAAAVFGLAELQPDSAATIERLVAAYRRDSDSALAYLDAFVTLGPRAAPAVPAMLAAFKRYPHRKKRKVLDALASIGPAAQAAVPMLEALCTGKPHPLRFHAKKTLRKIRGD